jgi:hypothetical protein
MDPDYRAVAFGSGEAADRRGERGGGWFRERGAPPDRLIAADDGPEAAVSCIGTGFHSAAPAAGSWSSTTRAERRRSSTWARASPRRESSSGSGDSSTEPCACTRATAASRRFRPPQSGRTGLPLRPWPLSDHALDSDRATKWGQTKAVAGIVAPGPGIGGVRRGGFSLRRSASPGRSGALPGRG